MASRLIVSNSTPLINFATIGEFDILRKLFTQIYVPQAVWQKLNHYFAKSFQASSTALLRGEEINE